MIKFNSTNYTLWKTFVEEGVTTQKLNAETGAQTILLVLQAYQLT